MKRLLYTILFLIAGFAGYANNKTDSVPSGLPAPHNTQFYWVGWVKTDSGLVMAVRDTTMRPKFAGTTVLWLHAGVDTAYWGWNGFYWFKVGNATGGTLQFEYGGVPLGPINTLNIDTTLIVGFNGQTGTIFNKKFPLYLIYPLYAPDSQTAAIYQADTNMNGFIDSTHIKVYNKKQNAIQWLLNGGNEGGLGGIVHVNFTNGFTISQTDSTVNIGLSPGTSNNITWVNSLNSVVAAAGVATVIKGDSGLSTTLSGDTLKLKIIPDTVFITYAGSPGDSIMWTGGSKDSIYSPRFRDSLGFHHVFNPDGSLTLYATGGGGSVTGANNGDTLISGNVGLGGSLLRNTTIHGIAHSLLIDSLTSFTFVSKNYPVNNRIGSLSVSPSSALLTVSDPTISPTAFAQLNAVNFGSGNLEVQLTAQKGSYTFTPYLQLSTLDTSAILAAKYVKLEGDTSITGGGIFVQSTGMKYDGTGTLASLLYNYSTGQLYYGNAIGSGGGGTDSAIWKSTATYTGNQTLTMNSATQTFNTPSGSIEFNAVNNVLDVGASGSFNQAIRGISGSAAGVNGQSTTGIGVLGNSVNFVGISGTSQNYFAVAGTSTSRAGGAFSITPSDASTVKPILELFRGTSGTPVVGIGGMIDFIINSDALGNADTATQLQSKWTNVTGGSLASQFSITGVNASTRSTIFSLLGTGQLQLPKYLLTTSFSGTPVGALGFDASGNILTMAAGGGGGSSLANFYLKDSSLSSTRTVQYNGHNLNFEGNQTMSLDDSANSYNSYTGFWTQHTPLIIGGKQSTVTFDMDSTTANLGTPWGDAGFVYRTHFPPIPKWKSPPSNSQYSFGDSVIAASTFHYANVSTNPYAMAFEWWMVDTSGKMILPLQIFSSGQHFAGGRPLPTVEAGYGFSIGEEISSSEFSNLTGTFNVEANSQPFHVFNLPTQSYTRATDFQYNITSAGQWEKFNPRTADMWYGTLSAADKLPTYNYLSGLTPQLRAHGPTAGLELSSDGTNGYNIDNEIFFSRQGAGLVIASNYPSDSAVFAMKSTNYSTVGTGIDFYLATNNSHGGGLGGQHIMEFLPQGLSDGALGVEYLPTVAALFRLTIGEGFGGLSDSSSLEVNSNSFPIYFKSLAKGAATTSMKILGIDSVSGKTIMIPQPSSGITGSGTSTQITYWTGSTAVAGSANNTWDNTNFINSIITPTTANTVFTSFLAKNTQTASASNQSIGGAFESDALAWKTTATAASQAVNGRWYTEGVQGTTNPTALMHFQTNINAAGWTDQMTIDNSGNVNAFGILEAGNNSISISYNAGVGTDFKKVNGGGGYNWRFIDGNGSTMANIGGAGTYFINNTLIGTSTAHTGALQVTGSIYNSGMLTGSVANNIVVQGSDSLHRQVPVATLFTSPAFTGTPTAPTATFGDNTTQIATDAFVQSAVSGGSLIATNNTWTGTNTFQKGIFTSGNITAAAWGSAGINFGVAAATYTDNSSSGTIGTNYVNAFAQPTLVASSATVYTNAATVFIANAPANGTNVTQTSSWALFVGAGTSGFGGGLTSGAGSTSNMSVTGGTAIAGSNSTASLLFGGASAVNYRAAFNGGTSTTITAGNSYANTIIGLAPVTTPATGTNAWLVDMAVNGLGTVTGGGSTITNTASLYVGAASSAGTNNYSIYSAGSVYAASLNLAGTPITATGTQINYLAPASNMEVELSSTTGINAKSVANTTLYTVPAGKTCVITRAVVRCTAASAITNGPTANIFNVSASDIYTSTAINALTTTTTLFHFNSVGMSVSAAAASTITFSVTNASTGTSQTVAVDLFGYIF